VHRSVPTSIIVLSGGRN